MADNTIPVAFIKQYEAEVHAAYQRQGSKLRGTVRTKSGVVGASTIFQKVGKGTATTKARGGLIPAMNVDHSNVECFLSDYYAGDWIDKLDELKTNIDERQVVVNAGAWALGRKTDDLIIAALTTSTNILSGSGDVASTAGLTKAKVLAALAVLNTNDVPDDGRRYAVVGPNQWNDLLNITEFANTQFIGNTSLPYMGGVRMKEWLGVTWITHSGLTITSGVRTCFLYHQNAAAHAIGADVTADITWEGPRAAHWVNHMMSQGAVLIDAQGVLQLPCTES